MLSRAVRMLGRRPRWLWVVLAACILVGSLLTWRWVLAPPTTSVADVPAVDAVVMFAGGRGERLDKALEVMETGRSPVLVIPNGLTPTWPQANAVCEGGRPYEVICPYPDPDDTRGEARTFADLAARSGWDRLVMVTSTYHVSRAELMLARCYDGGLTVVDATPPDSGLSWLRHSVREWLGHIEARVLSRSC